LLCTSPTPLALKLPKMDAHHNIVSSVIANLQASLAHCSPWHDALQHTVTCQHTSAAACMLLAAACCHYCTTNCSAAVVPHWTHQRSPPQYLPHQKASQRAQAHNHRRPHTMHIMSPAHAPSKLTAHVAAEGSRFNRMCYAAGSG
jgi:hypothetical protein